MDGGMAVTVPLSYIEHLRNGEVLGQREGRLAPCWWKPDETGLCSIAGDAATWGDIASDEMMNLLLGPASTDRDNR